MNDLKIFLKNFFNNQGHHVFVSLLVGKITAFLGSLLIIHLLSKEDFGKVTLVASLFAIFSSATGFGNYQSLLRFGSLTEDIHEKNNIAAYLLIQGFVYQTVLLLVFLLIGLYYTTNFEAIFILFIFYALRLLGTYFQNFIFSYYRIVGNNRKFASINNWINVMGLFLIIILTYFFQLHGFLIAIAIAPFISLLYYKKPMWKYAPATNLKKKELWNYALHTSGTTIFSELLFAVDVLIIGFLLTESSVADYKTAILLPANITFLSIVFMQTDFPKLAKMYTNRNFLIDYIINYYKLFIPVCIVIFVLGFWLGEDVLNTLFPKKYSGNHTLFLILLGAFLCNMLFRNLFGNLLAAVGKMSLNTIGSAISLLLIIFLGYIFTHQYQEIGMAWAVFIAFTFSGVFYAVSFYSYWSRLK